MATVDQRVSYIEGSLASLATKEGLSDLKTGLSDLKADLRGDLLKVVIGLATMQFVALAAVAGVVAAIIKFLS